MWPSAIDNKQLQQQQAGNNRKQLTINSEGHYGDSKTLTNNQNVGKSISDSSGDSSSINDDAINAMSPTSISLDTTDEDDNISSVSEDDDSSFDDNDDDDVVAEGNQAGDASEKTNYPLKTTSACSGSVSDLSFNAMTISPSSELPIVSSVSPLSTCSRDNNNGAHDDASSTIPTERTKSIHIVAKNSSDHDTNTIKSQPTSDAPSNAKPEDDSTRSTPSAMLLVNNEADPMNDRLKISLQSSPVLSCSDVSQLNSCQTQNTSDKKLQDCTTIVYCGPPPVKPPRGANAQLSINHSTPL